MVKRLYYTFDYIVMLHLESSLPILLYLYILSVLMALVINIIYSFILYLFLFIHVKLQELMECMPGPDFPTGGIIMGTEGYASSFFFLLCKSSNKLEF